MNTNFKSSNICNLLLESVNKMLQIRIFFNHNELGKITFSFSNCSQSKLVQQ